MKTLTYKVFALNFGGCLPLLMSLSSLKTYFFVLDFRPFVLMTLLIHGKLLFWSGLDVELNGVIEVFDTLFSARRNSIGISLVF